MEKELYTYEEVAKMSEVSVGTISRWVKAGKVEVIYLPSGQPRIPLATIQMSVVRSLLLLLKLLLMKLIIELVVSRLLLGLAGLCHLY